MSQPSIQTSGALFEWVQTLRVWEDSKTFPDSLPLVSPQQIENDFQAFLAEFAAAHAELPPGGGGEYPNQAGIGWTNGVVTAFIDLLAAGPDALAYRLAGGG